MARKGNNKEISIAELTKKVNKAEAALTQLVQLFPEAQALPVDDRNSSRGKIGPAESKALRGVIAAIDSQPQVFASLADEDEGHDPSRLETNLLRDRLDRHDLYLALAIKTEQLATLFSDTALALGARVKPVTLAAYQIAKPISKRDASVRAKLAPALNYYGSNAAASLASRKAKTKA